MKIKDLKVIVENLDDNIDVVIDDGFGYYESTYIEFNNYENQLQIGKGDCTYYYGYCFKVPL